MGGSGEKLMRRLEDVPDLRCLKVGGGRGCMYKYKYMCVLWLKYYSCILTISIFLIRFLMKSMHLIAFVHPCKSAASFMYSVYLCVTSGGFHLLPESVAGSNDFEELLAYTTVV